MGHTICWSNASKLLGDTHYNMCSNAVGVEIDTEKP